MDPTPRQQLGELRRLYLLAEADERRRAAQVQQARHMRLLLGRFFLAWGRSLTRVSTEQPRMRLKQCLSVQTLRCEGLYEHPVQIPACRHHTLQGGER